MKTLFKNCDIVTTTASGFQVIRNGFCGVDGAYICYLGTDKPAEKYNIIKDMTGRVLYPRPDKRPQPCRHDAASRHWQRLAAKGMAVR